MTIELYNNDIEMGLEKEECPICFDNMTSNVTLCCGHKHCLMCHTNFIKNEIKSCAFCRQEITSIITCLDHIDEIKSSTNLLNNTIIMEVVTVEKYKIVMRGCCIILLIVVFILLVMLESNDERCN